MHEPEATRRGRAPGCRALARRQDCLQLSRGAPSLADVHQVVEVPPGTAEVTEYQRYKRTCACGATTTAGLPEGVPPTCVGPRLQAVLTTLTGRYRLSRREAQEVLVSLYGAKAEVALGTIFDLEKRSSEALRPAYEEARSALQEAPAANVDETGWKEAKG